MDDFQRLELKGKNFEVFVSACDLDVEKFSNNIKVVDPDVCLDKLNKASLLQKFLDHCCQVRLLILYHKMWTRSL